MGQVEFDEQGAGSYQVRRSFEVEQKTKMAAFFERLGVPATYTKYAMILIIIVFFAISLFVVLRSTGTNTPRPLPLPPGVNLPS